MNADEKKKKAAKEYCLKNKQLCCKRNIRAGQ